MLTLTEAPFEKATGPRSQASLAYEMIRADILSGRHPPEKRLKIQDLAAEIDVSPGAVREALSRLIPEQLVVSRDQRGFVVAPLSFADLEDLTDVRCEIETVALRRSVERGDVNWEAALIAAAHRLNAGPLPITHDDLARNPSWVSYHADFHNALVGACGSRRLLALHEQVYEQSERYRGLTAHVESDRDVAAEHQQILTLALARDAAGLIEAMVSHIRTTTRLIVRAARKRATLNTTSQVNLA